MTISNNTSRGQPFGVHIHDHDNHSTNTLRRGVNAYAVTLSGNDLTGNTTGQVGQYSIVALDSYPPGWMPTNVPSNTSPRALTVKAVAPVTSRCATGTQPQTFAFPASDAAGISQINSIEVFFSISGNDNDGGGGPDAGAQGCHFIYYPSVSTVYLDGPNGGSTWSAGSSSVGANGSDLSNGYCTIHANTALWPPAPMSEPYISPFISNLALVFEFPQSVSSSERKHIYSIVSDVSGQKSDAQPKYWGWWATQ